MGTDVTEHILWEEILPGGATCSHILKRGTALRITDLQGGANVAAMLYNAHNPVERYNMPDTLKAQHIARLTKGFCLYSDMGRILCSVTEDTCGWHDTVCGHADAALVRERFGQRTYQEGRNSFYQNARDGFLIELAKYGLGPRDLIPNLNFFSRVTANDEGALEFRTGNSKAGDLVDLRAEMDILVLLNTCQHPFDPARQYDPKPVRLTVVSVPPAAADDFCRLSRPENGRGFVLTERYV